MPPYKGGVEEHAGLEEKERFIPFFAKRLQATVVALEVIQVVDNSE